MNEGSVVLLVGCGRWGRLILRDLVALGCTVHVVARSGISRQNASLGGAAVVHAEIPQTPGFFDGVIVATTTSSHHAAVHEVVRALGPHLPVFCEKPLSDSLSSAREMAEVSPRLLVMDKWRYHPGILRMAKAARASEFGALVGVRCLRVQDTNPHPDVSPAWTYLPHDLSIILEIVGMLPDFRSSAGDASSLVALLGSLDGPWAHVQFSARAPAKERRIIAYFSEATLSLNDPMAESLVLCRKDGSEAALPIPAELPLLAELKAFVRHLDGDAPPKSPASDGLLVVGLIEQILAEAAS